MIKVEIENLVNERNYASSFASIEEAEAWIESCEAKGSWGLGQRQMYESDMSDFEKTRVMTKEMDEDREEWLCNVKKDYVITIYDASSYKENRAKEYPDWNEVLEALAENMEGRPQKLNAVKAQREYVRNKYPKDETELLERRE